MPNQHLTSRMHNKEVRFIHHPQARFASSYALNSTVAASQTRQDDYDCFRCPNVPPTTPHHLSSLRSQAVASGLTGGEHVCNTPLATIPTPHDLSQLDVAFAQEIGATRCTRDQVNQVICSNEARQKNSPSQKQSREDTEQDMRRYLLNKRGFRPISFNDDDELVAEVGSALQVPEIDEDEDDENYNDDDVLTSVRRISSRILFKPSRENVPEFARLFPQLIE